MQKMKYVKRTYRNFRKKDEFLSYVVLYKESDLFIKTKKDLRDKAYDYLLFLRFQIEEFGKKYPIFFKSLKPISIFGNFPEIIEDMIFCSQLANVGPMASVAGAIAEHLGRYLLKFTDEVIIENGGDIFIKVNKPKKIGIFAGSSPLSGKIAIEVNPAKTPLGICTSSGTVGHSLSFGKADAVVVITKSATLSDAYATYLANKVKNENSIPFVLKLAQNLKYIEGVIIIVKDKIGILGDIKIV